jgi:transposase
VSHRGTPARPQHPVLDRPQEEQAALRAALRRARDGDLLALHLVLLCATGRRPTAIAAVLFCSRSSVYRTGRAYQAGTLGLEDTPRGRLIPPRRPTVLVPTLRRALLALVKAPPRAYGGCRTRWSWATRALTRQAKRGMTVSTETRRRWRHALDGVWNRAKRVAREDAPPRIDRLARLRDVFPPLKPWESMGVADERAMHLGPKVGCAWMPNGSHLEVMTPGQNQQPSLAGALELTPGTRPPCLGPRQTHARCRDLLPGLDAR